MNVTGVFAAVESHAAASGLFDRVNTHEPKNAPGNGLTCAIWLASLAPVPSSGLAATSVRLVLMLRLYLNMLQEPQDGIDPAVLTATDTLIDAYVGDFTLGGLIRAVDIRGIHGTPLGAQAGYLPIGDATYRTVDIVLPLLINDVWDEVA